jgi:hypothetical protein
VRGYTPVDVAEEGKEVTVFFEGESLKRNDLLDQEKEE